MPRYGQAPRGIIEITAEVVSAYVARNPVPASQLPSVLGDVYAALQGLAGRKRLKLQSETENLTPAQIRKSVTPDVLISFIDGKPYKTLKRHLAGHGLDPHSYRARYGLAKDYPMVAPNYAARRSELAKAIGLGLARADAGPPVASSRAGDAAPRTDRRRKATA